MDTAPPPELTQVAAEDAIQTALASLTNGYACRTGYSHVSYDQAHLTSSFRLGVSARGIEDDPHDPPSDGDRFEGNVQDFSVMLVEGTCVWAPGCSDDVVANCSQQLDRRWIGTGGTFILEHTATGVKGELRDLELTEADARLKPRAGGVPVSLPLVELPERPYWTR